MKELMNIQAKVRAPKNSENAHGHYKYRKAEQILEAVKPYLLDEKCTLVITDDIVLIGASVYLKATATLRNEKGETENAIGWAREAQTLAGMSAGQITGATSSYARKYALCGLFAIDDSKDLDDDSATKNLQEDNELEIAINELRMCQSVEEVKSVWNKWAKFKANNDFLNTCTEIGNSLKS